MRDAGHGRDEFQRLGQEFTALRQRQGLFFQRGDPARKVRDVQAQVAADDLGHGRHLHDGMEAVLLARRLALELGEPAGDRLQGQHVGGRRSPDHERHPAQVIEDAKGINPIGLGSLHSSAQEVFHRPWIDDHYLHTRMALQPQCET